MKAREMLLECKIKLNVASDYALGQKLGIDRKRIGDYMKGDRKPDELACFKIAETLNKDPALVIAEINAETEGKRGEYFRDFISRQSLPVVAGVLALTLCATYTPEANAATFDQNEKLNNPRIMYIMSNVLAENWALILPLFALMLWVSFHHHPHPKKETVKLSGK